MPINVHVFFSCFYLTVLSVVALSIHCDFFTFFRIFYIFMFYHIKGNVNNIHEHIIYIIFLNTKTYQNFKQSRVVSGKKVSTLTKRYLEV